LKPQKGKYTMSNLLSKEDSPYLLQH